MPAFGDNPNIAVPQKLREVASPIVHLRQAEADLDDVLAHAAVLRNHLIGEPPPSPYPEVTLAYQDGTVMGEIEGTAFRMQNKLAEIANMLQAIMGSLPPTGT